MTVHTLGRRNLAALFPFPSGMSALGVSAPDYEHDAVSFSFRRFKRRADGIWGWLIFIHYGRHMANVEHYHPERPFPSTLAGARAWVIAFCESIGIEPMENIERKNKLRRRRQEKMVAERRASLRVIRGGAR